MTRSWRVSATDPPPVEPSKDTHIPPPAPEDADNEKDPESPLEKRKMKSALDDFLTSN